MGLQSDALPPELSDHDTYTHTYIHTYMHTSFWKGIWGNNKEYNTHAEWLPLLEKEYCKNARQKEYSVTLELLTEILK